MLTAGTGRAVSEWRVVPTLALLVSVAALLAGFGMLSTRVSVAVFTLVATVVLPFLGVLLRGGKNVVLGAPVFFVLVSLLGYLAPLPAFLGERDAGSIFLGYGYRDRQAAVESALAIAAGAGLAFWAGWWGARLIKRSRAVVGEHRWSGRRLQAVCFVYVLVGLTAFGLGVVALGGPQALIAAQSDRLRAFAGINFLLYGAQLLPISWLLVLLSRLFRPGQAVTVPFALWGALALVPTLLLGTKVLLFMTAGAALLMLQQTRIRLGGVALSVIGVVGLVAATGYDLYFREYLVNREITSVLLDQLSARERVELVFDRSVSAQFMQLQNLAVIVDAHEYELPAEHGRTFLPVFTQLIPRKVWPGKPTTPSGMFAEQLRPDLVEQGTTFPPSFVGELYWNGASALVLVGMFTFGWLMSVIERWRAAGSPSGLLIGAFSVLMVPVLLRGNLSDTITTWLTFALPTWGALKFCVTDAGVNMLQTDTLRMNSAES